MDERDHPSSLGDLRSEGCQDERQGLAVMDGIVCQLTGTGPWAAQAQLAAGPAKDPFGD